jgi:uncharacterized protein (TIGR00162 family)
MHEKPDLKDPVLIEGLPGIGFVANIAALHIIRNLKAKLFAEINCSSFQDFAVTVEGGQTRHPINELYYYKGEKEQRDLLILYGNTQALTSTGQYELCGKILDLSEELGCHYVVTLGGLKREREIEKPKLYFAATDEEVAKELIDAGADVIKGQIFGVAGLLVGIGKLRGFRGFCLLSETLGLYPDVIAAHSILNVMCEMLNLKVSLDLLEDTVDETRKLLESFGLLDQSQKERKKESGFRWFV